MRNLILLSLLLLFSISSMGQYISLDGKQFKNGRENFYPIVSNYEIAIYENTSTSEKFISSHPQYRYNHEYGINNGSLSINNEAEGLDLIKNDFAKMKSLGFNTIRLFGFRYSKVCKTKDSNGACTEYYDQGFWVYDAPISNWTINKTMNTSFTNTEIINFLKQVLDIAYSYKMKVIFLPQGSFTPKYTSAINSGHVHDDYLTYLEDVASGVYNHQALFAWDLFNEPLYFYRDHDPNDIYTDDKEGYCKIVKKWRTTIEQYDNNHLITIGLIGTGDVVKFDPNLMDVDFISFHNYGQNNVYRSIYWYSKFSNKPWIIGETAFSAKSQDQSPNINPLLDDLSYIHGNGTLSEQSDYFENSFDLCYDCLGSGYSVWLHSDVPWYSPSTEASIENYYGLTDIHGNNKPAASIMQSYSGTSSIASNSNNCTLSDNIYYSVSSGIYTMSGTINDELGIPIEGAVISGRRVGNYAKVIAQTFTKPDGTFILYADEPIGVVSGSATGATTFWGSSFQNNDIVQLYQYPAEYNRFIDNVSSTADIVYKATNEIQFSDFTHNSYTGYAIAGEEVNFEEGSTIQEDFTAYLLNYEDCNTFSGTLPGSSLSWATGQSSDEIEAYEGNEEFILDIQESTLQTSNLNLSIYPNPTNGITNISINGKQQKYTLEILDSVGNIMSSQSKQGNTTIDLNKYSSGIYIVRIKANNQIINKKITVL